MRNQKSRKLSESQIKPERKVKTKGGQDERRHEGNKKHHKKY